MDNIISNKTEDKKELKKKAIVKADDDFFPKRAI